MAHMIFAVSGFSIVAPLGPVPLLSSVATICKYSGAVVTMSSSADYHQVDYTSLTQAPTSALKRNIPHTPRKVLFGESVLFRIPLMQYHETIHHVVAVLQVKRAILQA